MAKPVLGKSLCSDWFFLGQYFAVRTISTETVQPVYFCFGANRQIQNLQQNSEKKTVNIVILHSETMSKLSRMKGSVGLLSIAMRTIDFEAIFYQLCPVLN